MTFASYQVGQENAQFEDPRDNGPQVHIRDTTTRVSTVDGINIEDTATIERGNTGGLNPHSGTDHFGASAQNPDGSPVTALLPTTLVTIDGVQAPILFWIQQGKLQQAADGSFTEAGNAEETPQADSGDYLPISVEGMTRINDALEPVDQAELDGLAAIGIGAAVGRLDEGALLQKYQQITGRDSEESAARLDVLKVAYSAQADEALTARYGVGKGDLPAFYAWCRANKQGQLQEAVGKQLHAHDVSGYRALATAWLAATPPTVAALKTAGIPVRKNGPNDECYVRGQWLSPGAAARAGLL